MGNSYALRSFGLGFPMFGDEARAETAKLLDLSGVTARDLLHYREDGRSQDGFSPVKFLGRRNGFALLGLGAAGREIVDAISGPLATAWACKTGKRVLQLRQEGICGITPRPFHRQYRVPRTVVQHKPRHLDAMRHDPTRHLTELILRNLQTQAQYLGISIPDNLNVVINDFAERKPAALGYGGGYLMRGDITFSANVQLEGWWSFGFLTSQGFGQLNADLDLAMSMANRMEGHHAE